MPVAEASSSELGRGINFGGALEGDRGHGAWLSARHFDAVREAGFDTVRLPVKWSTHTERTPPYRIDGGFFDRVDEAIGWALRRDLNVVLDVHHFDELAADAGGQTARFLALWAQIGERYASEGSRLSFELLNEPHEPLTAERWNTPLVEALAIVRGSNPTRAVIVGPARWIIVDALPTLRLPDDDRLLATVHYYSPFRFTHQGADWLDGAEHWRGTTWIGRRAGPRTRRHAPRRRLGPGPRPPALPG
jgi:endoglucanase